jgi:hypothetical protein
MDCALFSKQLYTVADSYTGAVFSSLSSALAWTCAGAADADAAWTGWFEAAVGDVCGFIPAASKTIKPQPNKVLVQALVINAPNCKQDKGIEQNTRYSLLPRTLTVKNSLPRHCYEPPEQGTSTSTGLHWFNLRLFENYWFGPIRPHLAPMKNE